MTTEARIRKQTVELFRKAGYTVLLTSAPKKSHNTKGMGDFVIHLAHGYWMMADAKAPDGRLSEEQKKLEQEGKLVIFRDAQFLLDTCTAMRKRIE